MRRLSLSLVLASVVAACGGSGTTPTPVTRFPGGWSGPVKITTSSDVAGQISTTSAEGSIVWLREPHSESDAGNYEVSLGLLKVSYTLEGLCTGYGEGTVMLEPADGHFGLTANGYYTGHVETVTRLMPISIAYTCGQHHFTRVDEVPIPHFGFNGNQEVNGHIKGAWQEDSGSERIQANYDFTAELP